MWKIDNTQTFFEFKNNVIHDSNFQEFLTIFVVQQFLQYNFENKTN